jgi:hypothetical protein
VLPLLQRPLVGKSPYPASGWPRPDRRDSPASPDVGAGAVRAAAFSACTGVRRVSCGLGPPAPQHDRRGLRTTISRRRRAACPGPENPSGPGNPPPICDRCSSFTPAARRQFLLTLSGKFTGASTQREARESPRMMHGNLSSRRWGAVSRPANGRRRPLPASPDICLASLGTRSSRADTGR